MAKKNVELKENFNRATEKSARKIKTKSIKTRLWCSPPRGFSDSVPRKVYGYFLVGYFLTGRTQFWI